jgi:hypothetical protein
MYIDEPNKTAMIKFYEEHKERIHKSPGSKAKHQAWEGGYNDHVVETINIAISMYGMLERENRKMDFTLNDAVLVLMLHDIEKPFKYVRYDTDNFIFDEDFPDDWETNDENLEWEGKAKTMLIHPLGEGKHAAYRFLYDKYGFNFSKKQFNAFCYIHGEPDDEYDPYVRIMNPLAAFCHCCDVISARIWHDYPRKSANKKISSTLQ